METSEIKRIFTRHTNDIAFLIGNGININMENRKLDNEITTYLRSSMIVESLAEKIQKYNLKNKNI